MTVIWTLRYHPSVTAYLYSIRGTEKATQLQDAIKALQYKADPTEGCRAVPDRPGRFEFEVVAHWIGIELMIEDKAVRVLYVTMQ